jgi:hypothetical protein
MKRLLFGILFFSQLSSAHHMQGVQREDPSYRAAGNMVLFVAVPKEKSLRLYIVGKESAHLQIGKDSKLISVQWLGKGKGKDLEFKQVGNFYEVSGIPDGETLDLNLKAEVLQKPEEVRITVDMP